MKRILITLGGFVLVYALMAKMNLVSFAQACGGGSFCVIPTNYMHPWFSWFTTESVAAFAGAMLYILNTLVLFASWAMITRWGRDKWNGPSETSLAVSLFGCGLPGAVLIALWSAGQFTGRYDAHPILFWHEQMFVQPYFVFMMAFFSLIAACLVLAILGSSVYRIVHQE